MPRKRRSGSDNDQNDMKKKIQKPGLKKIIFAAVDLLLIVAAAIGFFRMSSLSGLLDSQKEAERWKGSSDMEFAQISSFIPVDESFTLDSVGAFREEITKKLHEAALDVGTDEILFVDAWSCVNKVSVSSALGKGDVSATAVGGEFFAFHPIKLISGSYISSSDLMQDRVLLDEDTAWLLFGGTDIQGMTFKINGVPFVVAGVIEREQDFASKKAYTDGMGIFMSYDGYNAAMNYSASAAAAAASSGSTAPAAAGSADIQCYELVMPNPVKNFALNFVKEKFPVKDAEIISNTGRYTVSNLWKLVKAFDERAMQTKGVLYPYWENAARCIENRAAMLLVVSAAALILPVLTALVLIVKYALVGKRKLEDDLLPKWKDSAEEAIRVRERRAWEKRHGVKNSETE